MDAPTSTHVLLTGATGFIGKVVLHELLRRRDELGIERVSLLIRPRGNQSARARFEREIASSRCFSRLAADWTELCEPIAGDITEPGLGLSADVAARTRADVRHIIHCAASVQFELPVERAAGINVTGALNVLEFAQSCPQLTRLVDVSTAYVTPHPGDGVPVEEAPVPLPFDAEAVYDDILVGRADERALLAATGHPNTYAFTKCLAEALLAARRGRTPLTLLRPSIVSACRRQPFPGWIDSNAAHAAVAAAMGAGQIRVMRMDPRVVPDIIPADDVASRILACAFSPGLQQPFVIRHAVAGAAQSAPQSRVLTLNTRYFDAYPHERRPRISYAGTSRLRFRLNDLIYHRIPLRVAAAWHRMRGRTRNAKRAEKRLTAVQQMDRVFRYFMHHTFDFRSAFPPLDDFNADAYLDTVSRGVAEHLLKRDPKQAPLYMHGTDIGWALRQPRGSFTLRIFAYVLRKVLRAVRADISVDEAAIVASLRQVRDDDVVILAPSHRSHLDFVITSLVCFARPALGLKLPRVAVTDDLVRVPVVGRLLTAVGALYIPRGTGAPDPELASRFAGLARSGRSLELYVEGPRTATRSATRSFRPPRVDVLHALQQTGQSAVILPLSISYDRVAEEDGFLDELEGRGRALAGLRPLMRWAGRLVRGRFRLGRIHVACAEPLRLDAHSRAADLGRAIVAGLQRHAVTTTFHLRAFCLDHAQRGIEPAALRAAITRRGGIVLDSRLTGEEGVPPTLRRTFEGQWMHLFYADALARMPADAAVRAHVDRHGFWFPQPPLPDGAVTDDIVDSLFAPIRRDHERVARIAHALEDDAAITPQSLVQQFDDAFLRDIRDGLDDLADEGLLDRDGDAFRRTMPPQPRPVPTQQVS